MPTGREVNLEQRAYGPDSTHEERDAIADRVSRIDERLLLLHELPVQSPYSIHLMFDRLESLARGWDRFSYVVDLSEAGRPDAETRAALKERVLRVNPRVVHVAIVVGNNLLMRAMARLIAYGMGMASVGVHVTRADAIEEAGRALGR